MINFVLISHGLIIMMFFLFIFFICLKFLILSLITYVSLLISFFAAALLTNQMPTAHRQAGKLATGILQDWIRTEPNSNITSVAFVCLLDISRQVTPLMYFVATTSCTFFHVNFFISHFSFFIFHFFSNFLHFLNSL